jgi:hypothetical protein
VTPLRTDDASSEISTLSVVIAGLVPAIPIIRHGFASLSEMAGTSPAMTC